MPVWVWGDPDGGVAAPSVYLLEECILHGAQYTATSWRGHDVESIRLHRHQPRRLHCPAERRTRLAAADGGGRARLRGCSSWHLRFCAGYFGRKTYEMEKSGSTPGRTARWKPVYVLIPCARPPGAVERLSGALAELAVRLFGHAYVDGGLPSRDFSRPDYSAAGTTGFRAPGAASCSAADSRHPPGTGAPAAWSRAETALEPPRRGLGRLQRLFNTTRRKRRSRRGP